jgi:CBS domain-containing protein
LLLSKKIRRLPVVDMQGKLVGMLSRGNIVKAALALRRAAR